MTQASLSERGSGGGLIPGIFHFCHVSKELFFSLSLDEQDAGFFGETRINNERAGGDDLNWKSKQGI